MTYPDVARVEKISEVLESLIYWYLSKEHATIKKDMQTDHFVMIIKLQFRCMWLQHCPLKSNYFIYFIFQLCLSNSHLSHAQQHALLLEVHYGH